MALGAADKAGPATCSESRPDVNEGSVQHVSYLAGQFLLAMPSLADPRFERSVIAVCAHDHGGAFGLCLHTEVEDLLLPELMAQIDVDPGETPAVPVLAGGPVEPQRGFVIHSPDWRGEDTLFVADRFAVTGTRDILVAIAAGRGPARWVAALGYAGWGSGQLETEVARNDWMTTPATMGLVWNHPPEQRWRAGFAAEGIDPALLSVTTGRA